MDTKKIYDLRIGEVFVYSADDITPGVYVLLRIDRIEGGYTRYTIIPYVSLQSHDNKVLTSVQLSTLAGYTEKLIPGDHIVTIPEDIAPYNFEPVDAYQLKRKTKIYKWV